MAYDKREIVEMAIKAIDEHQCTNIAEVLLHLPISKTLLYEWVDELNEIRTKIDEQKVKIKGEMKKRWFNSEVPALAIAAFKLIADEDEADSLTTSKVKQEHKFDKLPKITFNVIGKEDTSSEVIPG